MGANQVTSVVLPRGPKEFRNEIKGNLLLLQSVLLNSLVIIITTTRYLPRPLKPQVLEISPVNGLEHLQLVLLAELIAFGLLRGHVGLLRPRPPLLPTAASLGHTRSAEGRRRRPAPTCNTAEPHGRDRAALPPCLQVPPNADAAPCDSTRGRRKGRKEVAVERALLQQGLLCTISVGFLNRGKSAFWLLPHY